MDVVFKPGSAGHKFLVSNADNLADSGLLRLNVRMEETSTEYVLSSPHQFLRRLVSHRHFCTNTEAQLVVVVLILFRLGTMFT